MNPQKLILVVGPPGCGKTIWSNIYLKEHRARRVNRDDLRELSGGEFSRENESVIRSLRDFAIGSWLELGFDVLVDDTNLKPEIFPHMCALADRVNKYVEVSEHIIKIDHDLCDYNNKNRPNAVPQGPWDEMWLEYKAHNENMPYLSMPSSFGRDAYQGEYKITELPRAVLVDLDETLALHSPERNPYDHTQIPTDTPNVPLADLLFTLWNHEKVKILIITGRSEEARNDTKTWLADHQIVYDQLFMRSLDQPWDSAELVKKEIYEKEIRDKYFPIAVFDDQPITYWRLLNLPVYKVNGVVL